MKSTQLHNLHFVTAHNAFCERKHNEGKSASNIQSTSSHSKEFLSFLEAEGISNLKQVSQLHIDRYFDFLKKRPNHRQGGGLSNAYISKHREAVLRFMEFIKGVDVGQSGFFILSPPKDGVPKDVLTEEEVALLFEQCAPTIDGIRNKAMLSLLYGCGLRKGELHRLNVNDLNLVASTLRVRKSKTSTQRDVPMSSRIIHYLEEYLFEVRELILPEGNTEPALLLNNLGRRMSLGGIQYKVNAIGKQSGLHSKVTAHRLRHAIATHLLGDFSIEEIATFLGHSSVDSSQIYTHVKYTKYPKP